MIPTNDSYMVKSKVPLDGFENEFNTEEIKSYIDLSTWDYQPKSRNRMLYNFMYPYTPRFWTYKKNLWLLWNIMGNKDMEFIMHKNVLDLFENVSISLLYFGLHWPIFELLTQIA